MPIFALLERMMVKKMNFSPGIALRLIARSSYVGEVLLDISKDQSLRDRDRQREINFVTLF